MRWRWGLLAALLLAAPRRPGAAEDAAQQQAGGSKTIVQPDYTIYLKKDELLKKVQELVAAHPDTMKQELRHAADGDYKVDMLVVTVEPAGISPTHRNKARLLLSFGEHGREFITSEVGLRLLQVLADPAAAAQLVGGGRRGARLTAILQHVVLKVLPMENVRGRELVEAGKLCERKNGRGVDPNRNWDIDWGKKEKDYDPNEEYPGKAPFSEPEVQVVLGLAKELTPHVWLNVHSGMFALFTPYDHKGVVPNTTDARASSRINERIKDLVCPQCVIGSGGHSVGYLAHGTGTDYMWEVLKVPMSFTWEIYGDEAASFEDCFRMFNPLGRQHFDEVTALWVRALLQLLELLPTHPATWPVFRGQDMERFETVIAGGAKAEAPDERAPPAGTTPSVVGDDAAAEAVAEAEAEAGVQQAADAGGGADADAGGGTNADAGGGQQQADAGGGQQQADAGGGQQQADAGGGADASGGGGADTGGGDADAAAAPPAASGTSPAASGASRGGPGTAEGGSPPQQAGEPAQPAQQQPAQQQQQQQQPPEVDSTQIRIEQEPGSAAPRGDWGLLRRNGLLPLLVGLAGLASLVYCITKTSGPGAQYMRVRERTH